MLTVAYEACIKLGSTEFSSAGKIAIVGTGSLAYFMVLVLKYIFEVEKERLIVIGRDNLKIRFLEDISEQIITEDFDVKDLNADKYYEVLGQKAMCFQCLKQYVKSLVIYNKILKFINSDNCETYTLILINMVEVYIELKNYEEAKKQINIILANITELDEDCKQMPSFYCELGRVCKALNDLGNSENYLLKSLSLAKKHSYYFLIEELIIELV
jgi:tetratricopeptide (TPR) repeat protein